MLSDTLRTALEREISRIYAEVETEMVSRIAKELAKGVTASISPISWRVEKLRQMGRVNGELADIIRRYSKTITPQLEDSIRRAMLGAGREDDAILVKVVEDFTESAKSSLFESLMQTAIKNAKDGLNLTNTAALQAGNQAWVQSVNSAYIKTLTGSKSLDQAVKEAVRELGGSGLKVTYQSAKGTVTQYSLDAAVRRDVVTSVNQASAQATIDRMGEYGQDLVEVSSHAGSRPEHVVWQGKIFSLNGKTEGYELLSVATGYGTAGGLCGVNCRHTFSPFVPGLSTPSNTTGMPSKAENDRIYQNTQTQRYYERSIRNSKRQAAACEAIGDTEGASRAKASVSGYQSKMRALISDTGLTRQYSREQV